MAELDPSDELYRRLHFDSVKGDIVTSGAYKTDGEYGSNLSVHIGKLLDSPTASLRNKPFHGLGVFTVEDATSVGFQVKPDPLPGDDAHALLIGKNSKPRAKALAARTRVVMAPKQKPRDTSDKPSDLGELSDAMG